MSLAFKLKTAGFSFEIEGLKAMSANAGVRSLGHNPKQQV
jgi:hypothetical protein